MDEEPGESEGTDALDDLASELIEAVNDGDAVSVKHALKAFWEECQANKKEY